MKLYMHKMTLRHYAYTELLDTETGLAWSTDGTVQTRMGFERGNFEELAASKREGIPAECTIELLVGEPFTINSNCDPHGLS